MREDESTLAIVDLRQSSAAHVLVIPKKQHVETIYDLEPELAAKLMQAVVIVARAMRTSINPGGLSIWQSIGKGADQEVPHVHMHVFAREPGDGSLRVYPDAPRMASPAERNTLAERLQAAL